METSFDTLQKVYSGTLLSMEAIEKLSTKRILAYYKKHRPAIRRLQTHEDIGHHTTTEIDDQSEAYLQAIKRILNTREHIARA